jgi:hypothetical protein
MHKLIRPFVIAVLAGLFLRVYEQFTFLPIILLWQYLSARSQ